MRRLSVPQRVVITQAEWRFEGSIPSQRAPPLIVKTL
jgi:hypothetical protein